ncbi:hypothetical protein [Streptacidiphilus melanogenes]|uniref:hypothetical protein n=1 Tax=Streptacidiphilus melanogenes TaxID=411235 RepID=UPI0005A9D9EF|nr:hypothetical protein [Streptacidiphilus melanogenes]
MKALRRLIAPLALGMALVMPSASAAALADTITVGNADNGKTVNAVVGQDITVLLQDDSSGGYTLTYGQTASSASDVLAPDEDAPGTFHAVAQGSADLTAQATCTPGANPCPDPIPVWRVTIDVAAAQ